MKKKYESPKLKTFISEGTIELVVYFDYESDNDGDFVRCMIASKPNTDDVVIGDWRRTKDAAFKVAMEKVLLEKKTLNTIH
jgi:hypothetical protein